MAFIILFIFFFITIFAIISMDMKVKKLTEQNSELIELLKQHIDEKKESR